MFEQVVINLKNKMDCDIFTFTKDGGELEKRLSNLEKIFNLAPFILTKREVSKLELRAEFMEYQL
jgi:hypothetical protein